MGIVDRRGSLAERREGTSGVRAEPLIDVATSASQTLLHEQGECLRIRRTIESPGRRVWLRVYFMSTPMFLFKPRNHGCHQCSANYLAYLGFVY